MPSDCQTRLTVSFFPAGNICMPSCSDPRQHHSYRFKSQSSGLFERHITLYPPLSGLYTLPLILPLILDKYGNNQCTVLTLARMVISAAPSCQSNDDEFQLPVQTFKIKSMNKRFIPVQQLIHIKAYSLNTNAKNMYVIFTVIYRIIFRTQLVVSSSEHDLYICAFNLKAIYRVNSFVSAVYASLNSSTE